MAARGDADPDASLFDLDAFESEGEPFVWLHGGERFTFPPDPDTRAVEFLAKGDMQMALFALLGEEEYNRLDALPDPFGVKKFGALIDAYFSHVGIDLGKSSRPSRSARLTRSARALR